MCDEIIACQSFRGHGQANGPKSNWLFYVNLPTCMGQGWCWCLFSFTVTLPSEYWTLKDEWVEINVLWICEICFGTEVLEHTDDGCIYFNWWIHSVSVWLVP